MITSVLDDYCMALTLNRQFNSTPHSLLGNQSISCRTPDGREVIAGTLGLWCMSAGHSLAFDLIKRLGALVQRFEHAAIVSRASGTMV